MRRRSEKQFFEQFVRPKYRQHITQLTVTGLGTRRIDEKQLYERSTLQLSTDLSCLAHAEHGRHERRRLSDNLLIDTDE